jgi:hypothetical protein
MKKSIIKSIFIVLLCVMVLAAIVDYAITIYAYNSNIVHRYESYEPKMPRVSDFPGLNATEYSFENDHGEKLAGVLYSYDVEPKGIIIFAHGLGDGHRSYMGYADYFAQNGYYVFAFDVTGCDNSEGDSIRGVPQSVVDLDRAISFVEESGNFPELPIGLWGHSWGAYTVSAVLNYHPEVKAVIECAGCNASSDIFQLGAEEVLGDFACVMMPCVKIHEALHYGKYATQTAINGFDNSEAAVMCVHSDSDQVVGAKYGYDKYIAKYKDDPRFTFLVLEGRDHNYMFDDNTYREAFNEEFKKWAETLDYDPELKENYDRFVKDKADYINEHLDREKWSHKRDPELFKQFLDFYDKNLL